eukprot:TRINITY_DN11711_c0_g1_i7.p1 TRINITY_DN11711_c0_g1~~TRINITY_DN11711_c0_g1_i7.p1  ORF type:complete len:181 (+),score=33.29 TRINITY_DN11711_c0_g1_i7:165-707(+)
MKAKLPSHKSRSPPRHQLGYEDELIEELEDTRQRRQLPNALFVNKKPGRHEKGDGGLLVRKARSNSPKGINGKSGKNYRNINKYQSPIPRKHSPFEVYRNKVTDANPLSSRRISPPKPLKSPESRSRKDSSHVSETEETKALRLFAKKKHQLNKDLWEAAENGDLVKIAQLLEPYVHTNT